MVRNAVLVIAVLALVCPLTRADDEARKVLDKAAKAHGGADKIGKLKDKSVQQSGKLTIAAMNADAKMLTYTDMKRFKHVIELSINGMDLKQEIGYDGKEFWVAINGKVMTTLTKDEELEPIREALYSEQAVGKAMLGDKSIEASLIGEGKANDKPAIGVRLSSKGHKDVSVWFDKETGLMAKIESRGVDFGSGQETAEERIIKGYQTVDGYKRPSKVEVLRDGKTVVEIEITEMKFVDKLDDSTFAKP